MFVSVITPTYNRAYILPNCYESLKRQTCKDFEWIIVDDGSVDHTKELVNSFISESVIKIKYVYQNDCGKHVAHNRGVDEAQGELTVCVDSDDMLTENAIDTAKKIWELHGKSKKYVGILAKRGDVKEGKPICGTWPENLFSSKVFDLIHNYKFSGDTVLFYRTSVLKCVRFKRFINEKFLSEVSLYYDIDSHGEMILLDQVLYLCKYLPDGLTGNYFRLLKENPKGTAYTYYKEMLLERVWIQRIKDALLVNMYLSLVKNSSELEITTYRWLLHLTFIPAICLRGWFFRRIEKKSKQEN